ncbi:hypothetical protein C8R42DRAFT_6182 [Lentinula raphanica]|nr:hypothetical protein C8R42DRAFT_6182 [Lentinula raphanica]
MAFASSTIYTTMTSSSIRRAGKILQGGGSLGSHIKPSTLYLANLKATLDPILSPTTAHRLDCCRSDENPATMPMQDVFSIEPLPPSCKRQHYEPSNDQMLLHSGLLRHRHASEDCALATWISLSIQQKVVFDDPGISFSGRDLLIALTYRLAKSFQFLNPPNPAIFVALLYLNRIYPAHIPYSGNPDDECAAALQRLFLLCLRLALQWFEDQSEFWNFRGRKFKWHKLLGLEQPVFRNADVHTIHLLGHNLCISNVIYARWLSYLVSTLPTLLAERVDELRAISRLIYAAHPSLTPDFLHPNRLPCSGFPFDKEWTPAYSCKEEFEERGRNLMDCITYRLPIPLNVSFSSFEEETTERSPSSINIPFPDHHDLSQVCTPSESSTTTVDTLATVAADSDVPHTQSTAVAVIKNDVFNQQNSNCTSTIAASFCLKRSQLPRSPFPLSKSTSFLNSTLYSASSLKLLLKRVLGD